MKKRLQKCITIILLPILLCGCWNRKELNTLSIVEAVGVDKTFDGKYLITIQIAKPSELKDQGGKGGGSGGGSGVFVLESTGRTIFEAFRNATLEASRKLYVAHNKVIIIGESAAKDGIAPLLDFFDRDHEFRGLSYILITKGKAKDIIQAKNDQEKVPAKAIENLIKTSIATSKIPKINLHEFLKALASKTSDPFAAGIELVKKEDGETLKVVKLNDTAIFKDDKLIGWFDGKETRGLLWVLGKVKSGVLVVNSPKAEQQVSLEILRASSKVDAEMIDGKLRITVKVKEEANLGEQLSQVDLSKPDTFEELEQIQAEVIKEEIDAALEKAQKEWGADIFKFGDVVHRKYPKEWKKLQKNWDEEYKNIYVEVEVDAKLRRMGLTTTPENVESQ